MLQKHSIDFSRPGLVRGLRLLLLFSLPLVMHGLWTRPAEPVFGGDSNRHVVTSIFFRDFLVDGQFTNPKAYAEAYYDQYPALGLMIWPPLFHGVCGVCMIMFGTSVDVARGLVLLSLIVSCLVLYRITCRVCNSERAFGVTVLYSICPLIFDYSRDVMLEMPTLALVLCSVDQFDLWQRNLRHRNLYLASAFAALAALTRFDGVVLLPCYFMLLILRGGWLKLLNRHVILAAVMALCMVGPAYLVIAHEASHLHLRQALESVGGSDDGTANTFMALKNLWYYPASLPEQAGWPAAVLAVAGFLMCLCSRRRSESAVFVALFMAAWLTFSPLAELRSRHVIYWMPAVAYFAVSAVEEILRAWGRISVRSGAADVTQPHGLRRLLSCRRFLPSGTFAVFVYSLVFISAALSAWILPVYRVRGYETVADYVLTNTTSGDRVLFDGWWDGNFIYQMRHLDATRSRTVIRGDRLLYDFLCVPSTDFRSFANNDREMMVKLHEANPEFIVLENPQFFETILTAQKLRDLVHAHPQVFERVAEIPVESSLKFLRAFSLEVFRFHPTEAKNWMLRNDLNAQTVSQNRNNEPTQFLKNDL